MWKAVKLGSIYEVGSSKRVLKSQWRESGVPFYRGREITCLSKDGYVDNELYIDESHYKELVEHYGVPKKDDIMITAIGTIGNTYIVKEDDRFYFKDASVLWLRKQSEVDSNFIVYWLMSDNFTSQLDRGNGATVDTLTIKKLQSVELPLPPLAEQQRIVEKLDRAFEEIDRAIEATEQKKDSVALLKERYLINLFKGHAFKRLRIGDISGVMSGGTPNSKNENYWGGDIDWYSSGELNDLYTAPSIKKVSKEGIRNSNAKIFEEGTLLIGMYDTAAMKMSILRNSAAFNQAIVGVPKNETIVPEYLYYALTYLKPEILKLRRGVRQQNLSLAKIKEIEFPVTNREEQVRIVEDLKQLNERCTFVLDTYNTTLKHFLSLKTAILAQELKGPES